MKKFLMLLLLITMVGCSKNEEPEPNNPLAPDPTVHRAQITKLWAVNSPFLIYIMRLSDGTDAYMLRYRYSKDLHSGDEISYQLSSVYPNEIVKINGESAGDDNDIKDAEFPSGGLVASDPIEADVVSVFTMKWQYYGLTMFLLPFESRFIETPERLIYVKASKLTTELAAGDRIVYNVYTLFPHEVLAIKKLN